MKITKFLAIIGLIGMITVSCEKDPAPKKQESVKEQESGEKSGQKEVGTKFTKTGTYEFKHHGMAFEATFGEEFYSYSYEPVNVKEAKLIRIYENNEGMQKAVLQIGENKFIALFLKNITDDSIYINIDFASETNSFDTEEKAINAAYPDKDAKPGHGKGELKFGWGKYVKKK